MLRALVLLLALANLALLALNLGWVTTSATVREREPERLAREVNAGQVRITPPGPVRTAPPPSVASGSVSAPASAADAASGTAAPASAGDSAAAGLMAPPAASTASTAAGVAPGSASTASGTTPAAAPPTTAAASAAADTSCLLAGPMSSERSQNLALALRGAGFAPGSWQTVALPAAPSWMVLMGPYPNQATLLRKQRELARRKVSWLELQPDAALPPNLAPGLDLGRYPSEAAADAAEARLNARGVQSARVVALPPVAGQVQLRLPAVDNAQQQRLGRLTLPPNARWQPCGG